MSRMRRVKVLAGDGVYHCISRVSRGELLIGEKEKEVFRKQLWQVADFSGVRILADAVMSNHFH